ncbi:MotA/TolQ/ExbB proton channel family protein [Rosistilla oblonga]|uniref:MotA/TolQ/ExbB proton channel family protein n=1 Tax=Rosistilla oblonga TaxID=2527990 RepID=UPI003A97A021
MQDEERLVWAHRDIEQRCGFRGLQFTRVGGWLSCIVALGLTLLAYGILFASGPNRISDMFFERGMTPYVIAFFALWSVTILMIKRSKLSLQREALSLRVVPEETDFVLSVVTVDDVMNRLFEVADDPKRFVLLNRIHVALSNLRNLGRVTDVGEILRSRADHDESVMETSYNMVRSLVWAIPILGFIGTVSGLSTAIGGFGRVLSETQDPAELIDALKGVTGGLATAFETTLVALIAAMIVQMAMSMLKKNEEEFLDECEEFCHRDIVNRLRLNALESE